MATDNGLEAGSRAEARLRPPRKLYRASEVAEYVGVTRQTIHNYAIIGLITEEDRTPGGQKLYDESVFAVLARIRRLKAAHRLAEIRRILREGGAADSSAPPPPRAAPRPEDRPPALPRGAAEHARAADAPSPPDSASTPPAEAAPEPDPRPGPPDAPRGPSMGPDPQH